MENELLQKEVSFPNSGFSFPVEQAVWLSNLVAVIMLVLLRDRVGHALGTSAPGEPWLVLDARDRSARLLAFLWYVAIGLGPWLLVVTTVRMMLFHGGVYQPPSATFLLQIGIAVALFLMTIPLSLTTVSSVLRLKRLRESAGLPQPAAEAAKT